MSVTEGWYLVIDEFRVAVESDGFYISEIFLSDESDECSESERNDAMKIVNLVHAAPDLLAALESVVTNADRALFSDGQYDVARAAIAKARGQV